MIFDTEKQKAQIIRLVLGSTEEVSISEILTGPSDELVALVEAMKKGTVLSPEEVVRNVILKTKKEGEDSG